MAFTEKQNNPATVLFSLAFSSNWIQQLRIIHDSKMLVSLLVRY